MPNLASSQWPLTVFAGTDAVSAVMRHPRVSSLHVYPVKACKGIEVDAAWFERTGNAPGVLHAAYGVVADLPHSWCNFLGLAYDRNWMIVKEERGKFVTQRQAPK